MKNRGGEAEELAAAEVKPDLNVRLHDLKPADVIQRTGASALVAGRAAAVVGTPAPAVKRGVGFPFRVIDTSRFGGRPVATARRLPKRGFNNKKFATVYIPVNLESLNQFDDGPPLTRQVLRAAGLVNGRGDGVKILGQGKLEKKLTVKAAAFSASAKAAIEGKGGSCEVAAKAEAKASE